MKKMLVFAFEKKGGEITNMYLVENFETKTYELKELQAGEDFTNSLDFVKEAFRLVESDLDRLYYLDTVSHNGETYESFSIDVTEYDTNTLIDLGFVEVPAFMIRRLTDTRVLALFLKNFFNLAEIKQK